MGIGKKCAAEFLGTLWLVLCGCGAAVLSASVPATGVGLFAVSTAFGVAVTTMAYAIGPVSGCHINPAVSVGLWVAKRFPTAELVPYIISQVAGAIAGGALLFLIASGKTGFVAGDFASNGYGEHSPGGYSLMAGFITEVVFTMIFLIVILGSTDKRAAAGFAPIAIGLFVMLAILVAGMVTNLSINPARSTGAALFANGWAIKQLWMFWVAPILGATFGGVVYKSVLAE